MLGLVSFENLCRAMVEVGCFLRCIKTLREKHHDEGAPNHQGCTLLKLKINMLAEKNLPTIFTKSDLATHCTV